MSVEARWATLYEDSRPLLYRAAALMVGTAEAEEVVQETFERAMKPLARQSSIPAGSLHGRSGTTLGRALTIAGAAVVLVAAIAVGAAINNARSAKDNAGVAPTPTPAVTVTASPSGAIPFP